MSTSRHLIRSTAVVSLWTTVSRILGFGREILMAIFFGTTLAKSAFDVAFRIPNLFRRLFGEGALSAAFIPVFSESLQKEGKRAAACLAGRVMTMLAAALAVIVLGCIVVAFALLRFGSPGVKAAAVLQLLVIMMPYTFFICLVALCMAMLNSLRHFVIPAMTPVILNVVWIAVLLLVCPRVGDSMAERILAVAYGILAAGLIQLLFQIPMLLKLGVRPRFSFAWSDSRVRRILLLMGPAALGMGIHQINVCIDGVLALVVADWAPAALVFAERLIYLPLGMFATALGTVLLPTYSHQVARADHDDVLKTLNSSFRAVVFIMAPAAMGLIILGEPIIRLTYVWKGGEFNDLSCLYTTRALCFYAPGLVAFSCYKIVAPVFYAIKDTVTPVRVGIWMVVLNLTLNITFILTFPAGFKHAGMAMATVIASALNATILGWILHKRLGNPNWRQILASSARILICVVMMALIVLILRWQLVNWVEGTKVQQLTAVSICLGGGIFGYAILVAAFCRRDLRGFLSAVRRK